MAAFTSLSRYQRRKEKTRQDLLLAARKVLAEKGYYGSKIADIAKAADIGVGTFYLYFPTKDALFLELVEDTARHLKNAIDMARATVADPVDKLRAANHTFFHFAHENRELFKIIFGHGNAFNELLRQVYALFVADATERVREGIARGAFRPVPIPVIANGLVGMAAQIVSWWIEQEEFSADEMAEAMTDMALHGLTQSLPLSHTEGERR
jgi:AcrR family transcriptional regulator